MSTRIRSLGVGLPSSVPLVLSSDVKYDSKTQTVVRSTSEQQAGSKLVIVQSSLNLIKSIGAKPLAVLSICGPYRSGKSYFLSRFLGPNEVFKISNTDDPCTQGIWMSTSVLECDEFAILLLDTEGMESLDAPEDYIVKLLVVATTLSSTLIYNSIGVPERSDLDSLSQLSNATSSIVVSSGTESEDLYKHFPNFLWLVRDAALTYSGTPTEYLRNEVLVRSSRAKPDKVDCIVRAIISLFPTVECRMLPRPAIDEHILANMITSESQLHPDFIQKLEEVYNYLRSSIKPKVLESEMSTAPFNGILTAELLEQYVRAVNADQSIVLQTCWQSAYQSALYAYSNQLVTKYQKEMKAALQDDLPREQGDPSDSKSESENETLFQIHDRIVSSLLDDLHKEIEVLLGANCDTAIASEVVVDFEKRIAVYDVQNSQVESGELLNFVNENYDRSSKFCESVFNEYYVPIHERVMEAHRDKEQADISDMIDTMKTEYFKRVVGPAKDEVFRVGMVKLQTESEALTDIPGPPTHLKATKITKDQVTIRWSEAAFNERKVTKYTAECAEADSPEKEWKDLSVEEGIAATATELKPFTRYLFRVYAYIDEHKSKDTTISIKTKISSAARGAAVVGAFLGGTLASPVVATAANPALAPAMTVVGLIGAPVFGGYMARKVYQKSGEENIPYRPQTQATIEVHRHRS